MDKFQSHLAPRGLAMTPKTLGSRKRLAAKALAASGKTYTATAPKEPAPATAEKKTAKAAAAPKASKKTTR
jgi:hypothetical protein